MKTASQTYNRKFILAALGIALIGGGTIVYHNQAKSDVVAAMPPAAVTVESVIEKPVIEWDDFSGRVEAVDYVEIRPRVSGTIDVIHFNEGQLVKKGDLLFTIDPRPFQAEVARADAQKAAASAALELSKTELERS
jgi:multidrug efflux system membrane fusion protein